MANNNNNVVSTIYEIFRGCRLCGAAGGYKMPIIQNMIQFEDTEVELKEKIKECVQLEVEMDDKMPPLICELCADKVNDFYDFLQMCRQTNKRTRARLGLPIQKHTMSMPKPGNSIQDVTESVGEESNPTKPKVKIGPKSKIMQYKKLEVQLEQTKPHTTPVQEENKKVGTVILKKIDLKKADVSMKNSVSTKDERKEDKGKKKEAIKDKKLTENIAKPKSRAISQSELKALNITPKNKKIKPEKKVSKELIALKTGPTMRKSSGDRQTKESNVVRKTRSLQQHSRSSSISSRSSSIAPRETRSSAQCESDNVALSRLNPKGEPDSDDELLVPITQRQKRTRYSSIDTPEVPVKKTKITHLPPEPKPGPKSSKLTAESKPGPKSAKPVAEKSEPPKPILGPFACLLCSLDYQSLRTLLAHSRKRHSVTFTDLDLACNACGEWFQSAVETHAHHEWHKKKNKHYRCRHCAANFKTEVTYDEHFKKKPCELKALPDVKCSKCRQSFITQNLCDQHVCEGVSQREDKRNSATGNCRECGKSISIRNLRRHETSCISSKKVVAEDKKEDTKQVRVGRETRRKLTPARIRVARCDPLLRNKMHGSCDVAGVKSDIKDEIYTEEDYVHWDSDLSDSDEDDEFELSVKKKKVERLSTLSLRTIFSRRCLGKVPRKLRKVKPDKTFDSLFNANDIGSNINSIISNLGDDGDNCSDSVLDNTVRDFDNLLNNDDKGNSINDCERNNVSSELVTNEHNDETYAIWNDKSESDKNAIEINNEDDATASDINDDSVSQNDASELIGTEFNNDKGSETDASIDNSQSEYENDKSNTINDSNQNNDSSKLVTNEHNNETDAALNNKNAIEINNEDDATASDKNDDSVSQNDASELIGSEFNNDKGSETDASMDNSQSGYENNHDEPKDESQNTKKYLISNLSFDYKNNETDASLDNNDRNSADMSRDDTNDKHDKDIFDNCELDSRNSNCESEASGDFSNSVNKTNLDKKDGKINGNIQNYVNSDVDIDDKTLLDELDAQIGDSNNSNGIEEDIPFLEKDNNRLDLGKGLDKTSLALDIISDEDFNFNA